MNDEDGLYTVAKSLFKSVEFFKMIKYLIMDVDGTLTDGKIYMGNEGEIMKAFSIKDGCGIHDLLIPNGIKPIVVTGRNSGIVENRCREIGICDIYQNVLSKMNTVKNIVFDLAEAAYIGDDINDLSVMNAIKDCGGLVGCPSDAAIDVKEISDFVSSKNGGEGAVREFIEWILLRKNR